ncbi:unnamed protein product [Rhodiola kirilowii]
MYRPSKDMKSLSFCSIYKESFNIISSNTKLFTQIALFITFPLSLISIFATPLSSLLFPDININNLITTNPYDNSYESLYAVASSWTFAAFLVYKLASTVFTIALSLLSFSSVTYAVACIYTEHTDVTFKTTLCAFKRAWKKLLLTSLAEWSVVVGYTFLFGLTIIAPIWAISSQRYQVVGSLAILIISLVYVGGVIYLSIIWIFGGTVAILESSYGFKALSKSRSLIKGKAFFTIMVLIPIIFCSLLLSGMFTKVVVNGGLSGFGIVTRIACGVVGLPLVVAVAVFAVVVQTVTYLVCKADKGESIRKSSVMEHLDIYVDGYAPVSKDELI